MAAVRRATLAMLLCAAPLAVPAAAQAATGADERVALRAALDSARGPSARAVPRLPLPERARSAGAAAAADREAAELARTAGPARLLVGLRAHGDRAAVERILRRLGARPRPLASIGVLAARVPSAARAVAALRRSPGVAYVERERRLRIVAEPADAPDPQHGNLPFTWAYGAVRAGDLIAAAGGGSRRIVAPIDTGLDTGHPDLTGRFTRPFDVFSGGSDVSDAVGHGTFVGGLISAIDGNGHGGKGVAGNTRVLPVRASADGSFSVAAIVLGMEVSIARGADVINFSLAGDSLTRSQARALDLAFFNDVLPVAASGNRGEEGNPVEFPAAAIGGPRGRVGIGLSVAAVKPDGTPASFSGHNDFVSVAAPGAGATSCRFGVFSTIPSNGGTLWDSPNSCSDVFLDRGARYAYGEGTSFAAPIVAGLAALVWKVERKLESQQVGHVLMRSATQTFGSRRWNEFTGLGVVDGRAAAGAARVYDTRAPRGRGRARRRGRTRVRVRVSKVRDRTEPGHELAGGVRHSLLLSRNGGRSFRFLVRPRRRGFRRTVRLRGRRRHLLVASACDRNGNCGLKRLGRFRAGRR
jgi:subtilisin family serine protease